MYIFKYEGIIRELIIDYKFYNKPYISKTISRFLLNNKNVFEFIKKYDTIIPVPISIKRKKERGYNQSYLIAKDITNNYLKHNINIHLMDDNLIKIKNTIEQSKLSEDKRKINLIGAYKLINPNLIKDKKILLIDDIYTTGNTINECKKQLDIAKPKKVGIFVLAKD